MDLAKRSIGGRTLLAMGAATMIAAPAAVAQDYPARNVQMIVPYTAGGSADLYSRLVARELSRLWGKNVVVENRAGASGMIGTEIVVKAEPDGYTLLGHTSSFPATTAVRAKLAFDPAKTIIPLATIARAPMLIAVHPSVPAKSVKELIAAAKSQQGGLNYGSSGTGGNNHFSGALFAQAAGIKMVHVPYKGIAGAVTALASGEVEVVISSKAALGPQIDAGRVRLIAVTSLKPSPLFPGMPAAAESGVPGYSYELWWGIFGPAGMPADRVAKVNADVNQLLASPSIQKFIATEAAQPWPQTVKELDGFLVREIERYRKAAKIAGIKPQ